MRPPLATLLISLTFLTGLSNAQQNQSPSSESGTSSTHTNDSMTVSLLEQSHEQNPQMPLRMRLSALEQQAQMASRIRPDLAREWADELFTLSFQVEGNERSYAQDIAMTILARLDPNRALDLLHNRNSGDAHTKGTFSLASTQLVREVFRGLVMRDGKSALPVLQQEAERLAIQGHYPYSAMAEAARQATSKEWGTDKENAIATVEALFDRAFATYSQAGREYSDDIEFGNMLQIVTGELPLESIQPALRVLVKNLLSTDTSKYQFEAKVYTADGKIATADNAIDAALLNFGALINRDPELTQQLQTSRPELRLGLEYAKAGRMRSGRFGAHLSGGRLVDPNVETRSEAMQFAHINSDAAFAKAEQLPKDEKRSTVLLELARTMARDDPKRAEELTNEAQTGANPLNEEFQLDLISARVFIAVARDQENEVKELLQSGFEVANRIISGQPKTGTIRFVSGLGPLVQVGVQNDPDSTVAFLQNLPPSYLKGKLLLGAASALNMPRRLLGSGPEQKNEKSGQ
jgi:hypothetical protein